MGHEEKNAYEKGKTAMMAEATAAVNAKFASSKQLKKTALKGAIQQLTTGTVGAADDPVQAQFLQFFADKKTAAQASDDGTEELEARLRYLQKMNTVAKPKTCTFDSI